LGLGGHGEWIEVLEHFCLSCFVGGWYADEADMLGNGFCVMVCFDGDGESRGKRDMGCIVVIILDESYCTLLSSWC